MDKDQSKLNQIEIKSKVARACRFIKREELFQQNRKKQKSQLSYLKILSEQQKQLILESMNGPIPYQLPPLSSVTISYYRRANKPVYKTKLYQGSQQFHPHMTYESLFILAGIQEINFPNYQQVVKQFETDLQKYICCEFPQIREMAMIAAGNKILGKQKDIYKIIQLDRKQMWVMINHIYQRKIASSHLFPYLKQHDEFAFKSLFQMTNSNDDDIIQSIMNNQSVLQILIESLSHYKEEIKKYAIRIFGNIMAQKEDYVYPLAKLNILQYIYPFLNSNDNDLKKDACWALSNFAFQKAPATTLIQNSKLIQKLLCMLEYETDIKIKVELCHIFTNVVVFAQKSQVFNVVYRGHVLQRCGQFLEIQDADLIHIALFLISKMIQLGENFADEDGNCVIQEIKALGIKSKIIEKTYYTQNTEISKLSSQLQEKLEDEY